MSGVRKPIMLATALIVQMAVIAVNQGEAAQKANVIKPGLGVGDIHLCDSFQKVDSLVGRKFDDMKKSATDGNVEMWLSYKSMGLTLVYSYDERRLKRIMVTNKALLVEDSDISVGSTVMDLRRYQKKNGFECTESDAPANKNVALWDFSEIGITFWVNKDDNLIYRIEVEPKDDC